MSDAPMLDFIMGRSWLVVGVEPDPFLPEVTRVYVGARYANVFFYATGEDAEEAYRVWRSSTGHVVIDSASIPNLIEAAV